MKTDDKNIIGIVIECYDHNSHRVLVVQSNDLPQALNFFYIPLSPEVNFGDVIQMNFPEQKFHVRKGNSKLTYRIFPTPFPGSLLWELITERMNM